MRWFARTEQLLGTEGLARLAAARVAVFGLGGVGSFVVEALARAGVGSLRLVDYDCTNASNLNRQLLALRSTLGQPKVELARARVLDINPDCQVDARQVFINADTVGGLLEPDLDLAVDAIDSLSSKVLLLAACVGRGLPVLSSMGAGGRMDGGQVLCDDLDHTRNCPLARMVRQRLHRLGIRSGIPCVYSLEPARNKLPHDPRDAGDHHGTGRQRTPIGTISYMPALFGLRLAQEVIGRLLQAGPRDPGDPGDPADPLDRPGADPSATPGSPGIPDPSGLPGGNRNPHP
jgi:tRNA A37 threonylcarbamoyladenosine dehydratase